MSQIKTSIPPKNIRWFIDYPDYAVGYVKAQVNRIIHERNTYPFSRRLPKNDK